MYTHDAVATHIAHAVQRSHGKKEAMSDAPPALADENTEPPSTYGAEAYREYRKKEKKVNPEPGGGSKNDSYGQRGTSK